MGSSDRWPFPLLHVLLELVAQSRAHWHEEANQAARRLLSSIGTWEVWAPGRGVGAGPARESPIASAFAAAVPACQ